jgi:thymidylate synthase
MRPGSTITAHSDRDQIARVIQRLRADRFVPDATITTLQPRTDTSYLPRVSLLDFWLEDDRLHLGVNAHGIDFGMKGMRISSNSRQFCTVSPASSAPTWAR